MWSGKTLLLAAAVACAACRNDLVREDILPDKVCTLIVDATKGQTAGTRGLIPPDETSDIASIWSEGDRVTVLSATGTRLGTMTPTTYGSATTRLKAELTTPVSKGDVLNLAFPRTGRDYTGQKGTLADIATNYDYATATVTVNYADDSFVSATDARFTNQQAIVRFTLKKADNSDLPVKNLTIEADGLIQNGETKGPVTITPNDPTNQIYAALSGLNGVVTLTATVGNKTYAYVTPESKTLDDGNFYRINCHLKATPVAYIQPLTLECYNNSCIVAVEFYGDLEYYTSYDKKWTRYEGDQIELSKGDWVSFQGTNATKTQSTDYMNIQCNDSCYVYGNIMSLLSKDSYATMTELPYDYTFSKLFYNNKFITHAEGKDLVLPATTLVPGCYSEMFSGCSYLNYVKCLAIDISADYCTFDWLKGAGSYILSESGTCTFVQAAGVNWPRNDSGIPEDWDVKTE